MEILKTIRAKLLANGDLTTLLGGNFIYIKNVPLTRINKYITLGETFGNSESILEATRGIFTIVTHVSDSVPEPYATIREIAVKILEILNKKNETLTDGNTTVWWFKKTDAESVYDNGSKSWMLPMVFDFVATEIN